MDLILQLAPMIAIFGVMYLVIILPEKKRKKQYEAMLEGIQLNDEIMTRGGIVGKIVSLDGDYMIVESDRTRLKLTKNAIANKIYKED